MKLQTETNLNKQISSTWYRSKLWGHIAAVSMLPYALLKTLWAIDINVGMTLETLAIVHTGMTTYAGPIIGFLYRHGMDITAILAVIASLLSLSLVRSWGEVFPSWIPFIGKRHVPRWLVLTPAWLGGLVFTFIGGPIAISNLLQSLGVVEIPDSEGIDMWVFHLVYGGFFIWGITTCLAALAYQIRTRKQ
jgi:hypothetical protein